MLALYANVGAELTHYDVDVAGAALIKRDTVTLPAGVQYAWPHASRRYLYVATQQQRFRIRQGRDRASRHRVSHRSGERRAHPARRADTPADAADPHDHGYSVGEHPGRVQQSERAAHLPHQQGFHAGRRGEAAGPDRRRHLRAPGARDARQPAGDPGHARQRRHADEGRRPRRAESLRLQERRADQRRVDRARRRQGLRPAAPRFPSDEAVDVRVDRDAEQDVHVQDGRRQDQSGDRLPRGNARRAERTSERVRRRARSTCIRTAASCTARIARRHGRVSRAGRSSRAARTASSCTRSTRPPASRRRSSTSRRAPSIRARFTSIRAGA